MLNISEQQVVTWEMATQKGQDIVALAADEFFGYGVDSGTGGFMDFLTKKAFEADESVKYDELTSNSMQPISIRAAGLFIHFPI